MWLSGLKSVYINKRLLSFKILIAERRAIWYYNYIKLVMRCFMAAITGFSQTNKGRLKLL
jgi:hypothetical protein